MRLRHSLAIPCSALLFVLGGCGQSNDPTKPGSDGPNPNDKRGVALQCFTEEEGLDAQPSGAKSIQVGGPGGPRVEFFLSSGEAESLQFKGEAQESEQVGAALVFVNQGSDEELKSVEDCLHKTQ